MGEKGVSLWRLSKPIVDKDLYFILFEKGVFESLLLEYSCSGESLEVARKLTSS